jgi:hypothetical protein
MGENNKSIGQRVEAIEEFLIQDKKYKEGFNPFLAFIFPCEYLIL